jgi:hypothetical protein
MTEYCGQPDDAQWVPVAGDPSQLPPSPAPVVAEPVPEDAVLVDPETWDPCAPWVFPEDQAPVYEVTLDPGLILQPYQELVFISAIGTLYGLLRTVDVETVPVLGVSEHSASIKEPVDVGAEITGVADHVAIIAEPPEEPIPLIGVTDHSAVISRFIGVTVHSGIRTLWTPELLSDKELWLDGLSADTLTLSGDTISQWDDRSGNNRHAIQQGAFPAPEYAVSPINSKPGARFGLVRGIDGNRLYVPGSTSAFKFLHYGQSHIFLVATNLLDPVADDEMGGIVTTSDGFGEGAGALFNIRTFSSSSTNARIQGQILTTTNSAAIKSSGANFSKGSIDILEFQGNALAAASARVQLFINNTPESGTSSGSVAAENVDASRDLVIGFRYLDFDDFYCSFPGLIHELLIVSGNPDVNMRNRIRGYLAHRWEITDKLPEGQAFKDFPPLVE